MIAYVFQKYLENFRIATLYNLPVKFAVILAYFLIISFVFSIYKQNFTAQ